MKFLYPAFLCAFLNFLLLAQATPPNPNDKQAPDGKASSVKGWADSKKSSAASSSSAHEAYPKKFDLTSQMDSLLCSSECADMYFLTKEEQTDKEQLFPAHKPILLAASPVFEKMFEFNGQNKTWTADNPFIVTDISIQTFQIMLRFIYTDNFSEVNADNVLRVLHAADQYEVSALVDECVELPISKMKNVFLVLAEAQYIGVQAFTDRCFDYIDQNALSLLRSDAFLEIDQPMLYQILQHIQLETHSVGRTISAVKMAKKNTGENRREMLGPALYQIHVQTIQQKYFTKNIVSTGVLTNAEVISVFLFHSLSGKNLSENHYKMPFSAAPCGNKNYNNSFVRCWKRSGTITLTNDKLIGFLRQGKGDYFSDAIYIMGIQCKSKVKVEYYHYYSPSKLQFYLTCEPPAGNQDPKWSLTGSTEIRSIYSGKMKSSKLKNYQFNAKTAELDYNFALYGDENGSIEIIVEADRFGV